MQNAKSLHTGQSLKSNFSLLKLAYRKPLVHDNIVFLKQQDLEKSLQYKLYFLYHAIKGLSRKQKLTIPSDKKYTVNFEISKKEFANWNQNFKSDSKSIQYSMHLKSATTLFMQSIVDLKVNYKNVLQLKSVQKFSKPGFQYTPGRYTNTSWLEEFTSAGKKNVILGFASQVKNENDEIVQNNMDYMMVLNVTTEQLEQLKEHKKASKINYRRWLIPNKLKGEAIKFQKEIFIESNMPSKYGKVSGDQNIVHTNKFIAKLFGFKGAFLQGLCTKNFVIANWPFEKSIKEISINLIKPVYTNQKIKIIYGEDSYMIKDQKDKIVCHGHYSKN